MSWLSGSFSEEVTALAHQRQVCAVDEHVPRHEQSTRAVGDHLLHCKIPECAVDDHVLLESKIEQVKEPPQPTQPELIVKASQEAGFSRTTDLGQFFRTRPVCDAHGKAAWRRVAKNLPDRDPSKEPGWRE